MNILLDYFFPIAAITPTPAASTAFLKQVCVVAKPKSPAVAGTLQLCTSMAQVAALTDNTASQKLFDAGMSRIYVLLADHLELGDYLVGHEADFFTLLISGDFSDADVDLVKATGVITVSSYANLVSGTHDAVTIDGVVFTAQGTTATPGTTTFQAATDNATTAASLAAQINAHVATSAKVVASALSGVVTLTAVNYGYSHDYTLTYTDNDTNVGITLSGLSGGKLAGGSGLVIGAFKGVVGISSTDDTKNTARAAIANYCAFHTTSGNKAQNMFYAFGKMLSNSLDWKNQQYISMPLADDVSNLGSANLLFDEKVSFVLDDTQFGKRLGLFAQGGKAIVAPYITRNLEIDMQSAALSYISGNQPAYTKVQAALIEDELDKVVKSYIDRQWIEAGTVEVKLEQANFVASGYINIAEPNAMWRIFGEMRQTL